jgi:V/A-type H+-transporting ATPase subunit I
MVKWELYEAILPNPQTNTMDLMMVILKLGVLEIMLGIFLSMYNNARSRNYAALIGEKGIGMGLYVYAVYSAIGPGFTVDVATIPLNIVGIALLCSFLEPTLHAVLSGHGINVMQVVSQGIGGLMMTFVEGLSNTFSFLRIAAFAIAHASLAVAAGALSGSIGTVGGYVVMNLIAMSFELISSSVQSLRLLYYEFMGKFYSGGGSPFIPYVNAADAKEP